MALIFPSGSKLSAGPSRKSPELQRANKNGPHRPNSSCSRGSGPALVFVLAPDFLHDARGLSLPRLDRLLRASGFQGLDLGLLHFSYRLELCDLQKQELDGVLGPNDPKPSTLVVLHAHRYLSSAVLGQLETQAAGERHDEDARDCEHGQRTELAKQDLPSYALLRLPKTKMAAACLHAILRVPDPLPGTKAWLCKMTFFT